MIYKKYDRVSPSTSTTIIISCLMSPDIYTTLHFFMKYLRTSSKSLILIFSYLTEKLWIFPFNALIFFHVIEGKVFWNISQKQWICFFYGVIYFELIDFYTMYIQKTIGCTLVLTQKNYFSELSSINRIFSLGYLAAFIVVPSNQFAGSSLRTKISFFYHQHTIMNYCLHQK